ncbi:transcription factor domain-containing protein [Aspergillus stella-maris]|uniref:transcription factor domain-containing protein n=1 Tax=Aspergillus stella-maris TaxID=1810926 RepID=UPI003CCD6616
MDDSGYSAAAYGRACASCAQAKCKCLITEAGGSCARCRRLNRQCQPAPRTRKINPARRSVAAKTAQLEKRLDELTSLLQETRQPNPIPSPDTSLSDSGVSSGSQAHAPRSNPPPPVAGIDSHMASSAEDEEILSDFRTNRLPYLPFMYIPVATYAAGIKSESPFLWHCMKTLHCKNTVRRSELHTEFKQMAAQAMLVECQRSFDLLQALMIYLAWMGFECQPRKISLGPYMQMIVGLVMDMGLNRPPPQNQDIPGSQFIRTGSGHCRAWVSLVRSMDERRAVVGCFLLCSNLAHTLGRTDSIRWTPHMTQCLDILDEEKETPSDAVLVQLVRTQLVTDKVIRELGHEGDRIDERDRCRAPLSFYMQGLYSELDGVRHWVPAESFHQKLILLQLYHAETTIYEMAMVKGPSTDELDLTRLDHLYSCLDAIRKRFDVLLSFTPAEFSHFPSATLFGTAHGLVTLLRLSTFEYPGWDLVAVRQTADLLSLTQQVADKFLQVAGAVGIENPPDSDFSDCYTTGARILTGLRAGWAPRLPELPTQTDNVPAVPEFDADLIDAWLNSQDLSWFQQYHPFGNAPGMQF